MIDGLVGTEMMKRNLVSLMCGMLVPNLRRGTKTLRFVRGMSSRQHENIKIDHRAAVLSVALLIQVSMGFQDSPVGLEPTVAFAALVAANVSTPS